MITPEFVLLLLFLAGLFLGAESIEDE